MKIEWSESAWKDFNYWKKRDSKKVARIKQLLENISENPYSGIGKPEPLKFNLSGYWSRRIDIENRLVYRINGECIEILSCKYHYKK